MTTLSSAGVTVQPTQVLGYASTRESRNIIHTILGRPDPDVILAPAGVRTGTLEMLFATLGDALIAEALHAAGRTVTLDDPYLPQLGMTYVASGVIRVELDDESRSLWHVSVDFQEVIV